MLCVAFLRVELDMGNLQLGAYSVILQAVSCPDFKRKCQSEKLEWADNMISFSSSNELVIRSLRVDQSSDLYKRNALKRYLDNIDLEIGALNFLGVDLRA